jgi:hypothetical protein
MEAQVKDQVADKVSFRRGCTKVRFGGLWNPKQS